jgi:hypothetical protein
MEFGCLAPFPVFFPEQISTKFDEILEFRGDFLIGRPSLFQSLPERFVHANSVGKLSNVFIKFSPPK